jgi:diguanylate cyclase (GGDEF)-like protein
VAQRIVGSRGIARVAVAGLTVGLFALVVLSLQNVTRTAQTTSYVRAMAALSDHWFQVSEDVGVEYEALNDYLRADSDVGRAPLRYAPGSASNDLAWLRAHAEAQEAPRVRSLQGSYDAYSGSLRQVLAAGERGDRAGVQLAAQQAGLGASSLRKQAVQNAAREREGLDAYLAQVEVGNERTRRAEMVIGLVDAVLLLASGLVLLGHQRRTERQARESIHRALHDELTGIGNRALFTERLDACTGSAGRAGLLLLDLDRFKEVNDTLGHHQGDLLLREVAARLCQVIRPGDTVARLGGDEFAVLLPGADEHAAVQVGRRILEVLHRPVDLGGTRVDVGCSIGVALQPRHGVDSTELLKNSDIAMYTSKRGHLGVSVYDPGDDHHSSTQLTIFAELRDALETGQLVLYYQPKVDTSTGRLCGAEALLRWQHPTRGLLGPQEFIPAAERSELIVPITDEVIAMALRQAREWADLCLVLPVSVNVATPSLRDLGFPHRVSVLLDEYGLPPDRLTLEITETALISDEEAALVTLNQLRALGVRVSLDDFGTGYSSMAYLQRLPLTELKIDRRFITDLLRSPRDQVITRAVIEIAHALDLHVVGEGVEDAATLAALRELRCDEAQGYHICRPMPPDRVVDWAATWAGALSSW